MLGAFLGIALHCMLIVAKESGEKIKNKWIRKVRLTWLFYYGGKMNKQECKKYLKRAYKKIKEHNKNLDIENIEFEMEMVVREQMNEYIAYSKIAVYNMIKSGNIEITLKDLLSEIDILPTIYSKEKAIEIAKKL